MTIFNRTTLRLSPMDALRALFGRAIHLSTEIDVSAEVEVVETRQTAEVDPWVKPVVKGEAFSVTPSTEQ
jgi:hypothetical protein